MLWSAISSLGFLTPFFSVCSSLPIFQVILFDGGLLAFSFWRGTPEIWSMPFCSGLVVYFVSCSAPIYLWFCVSVLYSAFKYNLLFVIVLFYEIIVLTKMVFLLIYFY